MKWIPYVMVRVAAFYGGGIILGIYRPEFFSETLAAWIFAVLGLLYFVTGLAVKHRVLLPLLSGFIGLAAVFVGGYLNLLHHTAIRKPYHIGQVKTPIDYYSATVKRVPEEKENSWRMEVAVEEIRTNGLWTQANGNVLVYVSNNSELPALRFGDQLLIKGAPVELGPPGNPYEFDFRRFLSFRNVYHQQFVKSGQIQVVSHTRSKGFLYYSQLARAWAADRLKTLVKTPQEQAIALALVLGVTDGLDNELQQAYAASGAMHVLAVSGLHVGIIYWMILLLLKPIQGFSWSAWPIAAISLLCLWSYAFITGLSPSVLRAVTMFSFIVVARPFARGTNIYNTLAASAFILLLYNPFLIMSVGFQLSYLAVVGIVYLQRPLYHLWEPKSRILDWGWNITCVSIAAQTATFALGLLYFHQFPVYFLFSNLFVIPGSFIVLVLGIVLLTVSFIQPFAAGLGWLLETFIRILNSGVFAVEGLPYSLINGVHVTTFQCWTMMLMILAMILVFEFRKFRWVMVALLFAVAFAGARWWHYRSEVDRSRLVVYRVSRHGALEWIDHGDAWFYADSVLARDEARIRFHIRPNRIGSGVSHVTVNSVGLAKQFGGYRLFDFKGTTLIWIDRRGAVLPRQISADYAVIGNNALKSLDTLLSHVKAKIIILDSSNSAPYEARMRKEAEIKNIPVHSVQMQGAFDVTL